MLEMFILGIIDPIITTCFLFCQYYFFRIYVVSLKYRIRDYVVFYFFLSTFYFVEGSFNYFYLGIICFQNVVGITSFFLNNRIRGYIAFAIMPPVLIFMELVNGIYSAEMIRNIFLVMLGAIVFCELINLLIDIDLFSKYATSLIVINIASLVLIGDKGNNSFQTFTDICIPVLIGSIIIASFVYGYTNTLQQKEIQIMELRYVATYDRLTDLQNFDSFSNYIAENSGKNLQKHVVAMLDIDNFKQINDNFGHLEGNNVIKFFATSLKIFFNKNSGQDIELFRFGGEEFCVLFRGKDINKCFELMLRFQEELASKDFLTDKRQVVNVTFSGGVAETNEFCEIEKAIKDADMALYVAKKTGRAQIICPNCQI